MSCFCSKVIIGFSTFEWICVIRELVSIYTLVVDSTPVYNALIYTSYTISGKLSREKTFANFVVLQKFSP